MSLSMRVMSAASLCRVISRAVGPALLPRGRPWALAARTSGAAVDKLSPTFHRHFSSASEGGNHVARVQQPAPDFRGMAVVEQQFKEIQLSDFRGKYLVLLFYPLDFTFVCPTELISFSDHVKDFHDVGAEVVGISTDSHFSHLAWINLPRKYGGLGGLNFPLLSDFTKRVSQNYGVLLEEPGVALRGLFIIDKEGVLRQITINDLPVGRSVDEALRLIKAFQFVEKHGEVCPANWQPDSPTIKPNPKGSQEYFEKVNK